MGDRWAEIEAMPEFQKAPAYKQRRVKQLFFDKFRSGDKAEERRFVNDGLPSFEQGKDMIKSLSPLDRASAVVDLVAKARGESPGEFRDAAPKGLPLEIPEGVKQAGRDMGETVQNVGLIAPALDAAAHLGSMVYGLPAAGIAGLAYLANTGGIEGLADNAGGVDPERAKAVSDAVQRALIHQPMTPGGRQLVEAAGVPFQALAEAGGSVGDKVLEATGSPAMATAAHTAIEGAPAFLMAKAPVKAAFSRAANAVKGSTAFRMATVPERGLVLQNLQETLAKNPELTEGELARMSDQYFAEAMAKRTKGEGKAATPAPAMEEAGRPQEAPVAPQEATGLPEGQGFQLRGRPYGGTNQRPVVPGKHAGQIPEGPRALPEGQGFRLQGRPYGGTNQRPIVPGRERPMLPPPEPPPEPVNRPSFDVEKPEPAAPPAEPAPGETLWFPDELRAELGAAAEFSKTGRRSTVAQDGARWRVDLGPKLERWEMTPQEFLSLRDHKVEIHGDGYRYRKPSGGYVYHDQAKSRRALLMAQHEMEVADAVAAGKPVPKEVLRKYPELAREAAMRETPPPPEPVAESAPDQLPGDTKLTEPGSVPPVSDNVVADHIADANKMVPPETPVPGHAGGATEMMPPDHFRGAGKMAAADAAPVPESPVVKTVKGGKAKAAKAPARDVNAIPPELRDAFEVMEREVKAGAVERIGSQQISTYPKWFQQRKGLEGFKEKKAGDKAMGAWSKQEFQTMMNKLRGGKELTPRQQYRFGELVGIAEEYRATRPELRLSGVAKGGMEEAKRLAEQMADEGDMASLIAIIDEAGTKWGDAAAEELRSASGLDEVPFHSPPGGWMDEYGRITIDFRNRWKKYADEFAPGSAGRKLAEMVGEKQGREGMGWAAVLDMKTFDRFTNLSRKPGALFAQMDRWGLPASEAHKRALTYASYRDVADMKLGELRDALPPTTRKHAMEFTGYLLARRNLSRVRRGIATDGLTLGDAHAQIRETAAVANKAGITTKELKEGVKAWHDWTVEHVLGRARESGLLSDKEYARITAENDVYAAFRVLDHVPDLERMPDVSSLPGKEWFSVQNEPVIQRMTGLGEGQKIADPIDATLENFMKMQATAERNEVANALIDDPMWKGQMKRVAQTQADLDAFHAAGIDAVLKDQWKKAYPEHDTVWRMNQGEPEQWLVPGSVAEAMKQLSPIQVPAFLHGVNNVYRTTATIAYLPFTISNMARDFVMGYVTSPVYKWYELPTYLKDWAVGLGHGIMNELGPGTNAVRRRIESGGGFGFTGELRNAKTGRAKVFPSRWDTIKSVAKSPLELVKRIAGSVDEAPRMANFLKAERMGASAHDAALVSRAATVDFNQMGTAMRVANAVTPFLSARFQGKAKLFRAFRRNGLDTAAKVAITVAMPGILTYAWNRVNFGDLLDDVSESIREKYWVMLTGRSKDGQPQMVLVAKSDVGEAWNAVEYGLDQFYGHDTAGMDKFLVNFLSDMSPVAFARKGEVSGSRVMSDLLPPLAKSVVEPTLNTDLYRGRDLVPGWMEKNVRPEDQYFTGTPELYKALGKKMGVAPVKIQRVAENIFAGYGRDAMDIGAMGRSLLGRVYREGGGEMERRALEAVGELERGYAYARTDAKKAVEAGEKKKALMIMREWDLGVRKKVAEFDKRFSKYGIRDKGGLRRGVMFTPEKRRRILRGERDEREGLEKKLAARGR